MLIGGSYIGCEVAASLTAAHGVDCTIVMMEDVTFEPLFGEEVGRFFQGVLEEHGVTVHGGQELERFEGDGERVTKVVTKSGLELDCDFVVVGIGVMPDVMLARAAGLELGEAGGVRCSAGLESSVAGHLRGRRHLRVRQPDPRRADCGSSTGTWPSTRARPPR